MTVVNIKLPRNVVNIHLPHRQTTETTVTVPGATRITQALDTRVTRAGDTRVTRDTTTAAIPELVAVKLHRDIVTILVPV